MFGRQRNHLRKLWLGPDDGLVLPIPERAWKVAGHGCRDAGLDIQAAGKLQVGEGLGAREGDGAVQDIPLLAKDLKEF